MVTKVARVSAEEVLVRQPQDTRPLLMDCVHVLGGVAIASVAAIRVWSGAYPTAPHGAASPAELVLAAAGEALIIGSIVSVACSGGVHGTYYYLEIDVVDANGDTLGVDGWLLVKDHDA